MSAPDKTESPEKARFASPQFLLGVDIVAWYVCFFRIARDAN